MSAGCSCSLAASDVGRPERLVKQDLHGPADEVADRVAEELRRHLIREPDRAFIVDDDHAVGGGIDDADQQLIGQLVVSRYMCHSVVEGSRRPDGCPTITCQGLLTSAMQAFEPRTHRE